MYDDFEDVDTNYEEVLATNQNPYNVNRGVPTFDGELFVGKQFNDRQAVIQAINSYSKSKGVDYKVYKSEPTTIYCKCICYGIDWILQDHTKLDSAIIAQCMVPMIQFDPSVQIKSIIEKVQSQYGYTIAYRNAWIGKQKAMKKVYGTWERSYEELPRWCKAMCASVQGSIALFDDVEACHVNDPMSNVRQLRRVFWSFGPCIKAFEHCKPLIQVDGTHLCGKYKGILLMAIAQDGNKIMFPVAFAIVEGETADAWYFFLDNLRKHVVTRDRVCIISDCHKSIKTAIARSNGQWEPPKAFHMYCLRHIASNFSQRFNDPDLHKLVKTIGCSRTEHEFNYYYEQLRKRGKVYTDWLDEILQEKWVQAFDKGHRWGHMTTNQVECINGVLKGVCYLPITQIVITTYFRLNGLFNMIGSKVRASKNAGNIFSESVMAQLQANEQASKNIRVIRISGKQEVFRVQDLSTRKECKVDLRHRYCECGNFSINRYLCSHVMACCFSQKYDWRGYVDNVYRITEICKVYEMGFGIVGHPNTWPIYSGPKFCPNPALKRTMKGRPSSKSFLNNMDAKKMRKPQCCNLCQGKRNNSNRCPHVPGPSS